MARSDRRPNLPRSVSGAVQFNKLTIAGFEVGKVTYVLFVLFFPILVFRFVQNVFKRNPYPKTSLVRLPGWANALLVLVHRLEMSALRWINYPFGVTCVALARRPPDR